MELKLPELNLFKHYLNYICINMEALNIKVFMKKYNSKNDTMNESEVKRNYIYPIYPRDSKIITDKGFINLDDGRMRATHWTCFTVKGTKSYYFDSCGGQPDKYLLNQLSKQIIYHNYKI